MLICHWRPFFSQEMDSLPVCHQIRSSRDGFPYQSVIREEVPEMESPISLSSEKEFKRWLPLPICCQRRNSSVLSVWMCLLTWSRPHVTTPSAWAVSESSGRKDTRVGSQPVREPQISLNVEFKEIADQLKRTRDGVSTITATKPGEVACDVCTG